MGLFRTLESPSDWRAADEGSVGGRNHAHPVNEAQATIRQRLLTFMAMNNRRPALHFGNNENTF